MTDPYFFMWDRLQPAEGDFDHLTCVGFLPYTENLPFIRSTRKRHPDPLFFKSDLAIKDILSSKAGPYYCVSGDVNSVDLSFRKMDVSVDRSLYRSYPFYEEALDLVDRMLKPCFSLYRELSSEEVVLSLNLSAASGLPWGAVGLPKKRDFFRSDLASHWLFREDFCDQKFLWKVVPKIEWYHKDDIDKGKVRTFIIPPVDLVYHGKRVFGTQNENLKSFWWSAYGFNPYEGGVHRLAISLMRNPLFVFYDVSGWDRKLPNLDDVYDIRNSYIPDDKQPFADFLADQAINSFIKHPNGKIYKKSWGNNSGSWNTTCDNIIAHMLILVHCLLVLFEGREEDVVSCFAALFGDDNVFSLPHVDPILIENTFKEVFSLYGLILDPFVVTNDLSDCEFLGFKFGKFRDQWIPVYNQERLLASFCYDYEKMPLSANVSKSWTLTVMAAGGDRDVFECMRTMVQSYLDSLRDNDDPTVRAYVELGAPDYESCMSFYTGLECGSSRMVEGIKNHYNEFKHWQNC